MAHLPTLVFGPSKNWFFRKIPKKSRFFDLNHIYEGQKPENTYSVSVNSPYQVTPFPAFGPPTPRPTGPVYGKIARFPTLPPHQPPLAHLGGPLWWFLTFENFDFWPKIGQNPDFFDKQQQEERTNDAIKGSRRRSRTQTRTLLRHRWTYSTRAGQRSLLFNAPAVPTW